jgi:nicotinate phosphoribosyltransferase
MKFDPIVKSLLETDLYKFNMHQVMIHKHMDLSGEYIFKCRNENIVWAQEMVDEINAQVDHLCTLKFTDDELNYLHTIRFLKPDYIEFLRIWHPIRDYVKISLEGTELKIAVTGPLFNVMHFEIYLLEIVNEVYFRMKYDYNELLKEAKAKTDAKVEAFKSGKYTFNFAEFGARRRLSGENQDYAVKQLLTTGHEVGTSNVYLARKYNIKPIGTYAHEFVQMYQGISTIPLAYTNYYAMKDWFDEYNGDNGTALTDTLTTDLFLRDFDFLQASVYSGLRHDSGDPYEWGEKIIARYKKLGIDPKTKTLLFSDSLNFDKAQKLYDYFKDRTKVSFGIGTFISNDTDVDPLNIVIKLQYVNGRPVAKLSDCPGKTMCQDDKYLTYLRYAVEYRLKNPEGVKH